jgi:hypothetical protein
MNQAQSSVLRALRESSGHCARDNTKSASLLAAGVPSVIIIGTEAIKAAGHVRANGAENAFMSILGKVLIILNVLAAGAFIYLATVDWGARESWSYAVFRHDLALNGLPLDEQELDADGVRAVDRLSNQTLQSMLAPVGGGLPATVLPEDKTQMAEVSRLRTTLRTELNTLGGNAAQIRQKMVAWLVPLARTGGEREALRQFLATEPIAKLTADDSPFENAFKRVLASGQEPPETRRAEIAHLLLNMTVDPNSPPDFARQYQRVLEVVGLRAFAAEADRQYYALREMADRISGFMAEDQATFEKDYELTLKYLYAKAEDLAQRQKKLADYEKVTRRHQLLVQARQQDLMDMTTRLEAARAATQAALASLSTEQQRLFEAERKVAVTTEKNHQLEQQIRSLEKTEP